ncbi:MAG: phenylalanine--tRNA ligase subunit beta [Clostridia bacterium]|nr:phenylalanine--tRNA ligase subunit beta [Clostridia bacterium]
MKAPLSWLKEYVDINCTAEELKDKLFSCGFEVEGMDYIASNINKIVTCKIEKIEKHPNADKLSVCQVNAGSYGKLQIITNAKNIFEGAIVPVALDGATLFNNETISNGEIRGVKSFGMFCSGEELGINDDWYEGAGVNGILIFKEELPLGEEVKKLLELEDVMFDINVTANRPDCQSILGIAREVSAVLDLPLKMPDLSYAKDFDVSTTATINVNNLAYDLCPRYISHLVKDVKIESSPLWLKRRLFRMGIRSINNIVDITNYVLLEIGQPMHAFDLKDLERNNIVIRRAYENEKIITLDEKEFALNKENLVICDAVKPIALAGIMGGLNSGIKDDTVDIVFESAKFVRDNIRKTSKALGQRSDSSSRFEKGVDSYTTEIGMQRALNLIYTLGCGKIAFDNYDLYEYMVNENYINTTIDKINGVLGIDVPVENIVNYLERLNFEVNVDGNNISIKIPAYREDIESYPDIAEEIIREYGYDHIKSSLLKTCSITNGGRNDQQNSIENIKNLLVGYGFNEIITYSFVSEKEYDMFKIDKTCKEHKFIKIINPLGEDLSVMRTTLLPSVVRIACSNVNRKNYDGRIFELAKVYKDTRESESDLPTESLALSFATFGAEENFFTIKGVVEGILDNFCNGCKVEYKPSTTKCMHPTRCADIIVNGAIVGYFGQILPSICDELNSDKPIFAGEIFYEELTKYFNDKILVKSVSKFPQIERDLAILIDKNVLCGDIISAISEQNFANLESIKLFDIYEGAQVGEGKKSMAFNFVFVNAERTLSVEEVDSVMEEIRKLLLEKFNAERR